MAWTNLISHKIGVAIWHESLTGITSNTNTDTLDLTDYKGVAELEAKVTFQGETYTDESITLKLQKSANGSDWADTGIRLTTTNADGVVLPATFELSGAKYRVRAEVSGSSPKYDVEFWITTRS